MAKKLVKKGAKPQKVIKKSTSEKSSTAIKDKDKVDAVAASKIDPVSSDKFTVPSGEYVEGVGRRKVATARVRIYKGKGDFVVNNKLAKDYFSSISHGALFYQRPFKITATDGKFAVTVRISGSGIRAQLGAVVHGLSRALVKYDPEFRTVLKEAGLLRRDDRMKETRKIGRLLDHLLRFSCFFY